MEINQAYYWKEKQQMAEEFKIGTGSMPVNGKFSSSNLHIHKESRRDVNVNSTCRCSTFWQGGGRARSGDNNV